MIQKYSISIAGHATSITLEPEFWAELNTLAAARGLTLPKLIEQIDTTRGDNNLSSAIRVFVLTSIKSNGCN